MSKRVYSEKEVAELLRRTAELQKRSANPNSSGLTLDELESVASESGLDPKLLRMAAQEMHLPKSNQLLLSSDTTKTHNIVDRWIDGKLTAQQWEDVVATLRFRFDTDAGRVMGVPHYGTSNATTNGRNFEWQHTSLMGVETRLIIRPADGGHRMQMSQRVGWSSPLVEGIGYGSSLGIVIGAIVLAATDVSMIGVVVSVLTLLASIGMVYFLDKSWRESKHRQLHDLADNIVQMIDAGATVSTAETANADQHAIPSSTDLDGHTRDNARAGLLNDLDDLSAEARDAKTRGRTRA